MLFYSLLRLIRILHQIKFILNNHPQYFLNKKYLALDDILRLNISHILCFYLRKIIIMTSQIFFLYKLNKIKDFEIILNKFRNNFDNFFVVYLKKLFEFILIILPFINKINSFIYFLTIK